MLEQFLRAVFPYIVLTIFVGGHIYRYQHDQFGWTSKSSELLEKKQLRIGSNLFHFGIIFVFFGHVMGLIIPIEFMKRWESPKNNIIGSRWRAESPPDWRRRSACSSFVTGASPCAECSRPAQKETGLPFSSWQSSYCPGCQRHS